MIDLEKTWRILIIIAFRKYRMTFCSDTPLKYKHEHMVAMQLLIIYVMFL